jgi:hypothetical protein
MFFVKRTGFKVKIILKEIDGELYIYFAMNVVGVGHRPWALKANDPKDPMAGWSAPILYVIPLVNYIDYYLIS